jgi:hypothetical protein
MRKYIILALIILLSTALAQRSNTNSTYNFLVRCVKGEIAQDYSLACQALQKNPVLYRGMEFTRSSIYILLPSNNGIEKYLKAKGFTLPEFRKFHTSIAFTQAHVLEATGISTQISVGGIPVALDLTSNKIAVNGTEITVLGRENTPSGYPMFVYIDKPLEFLNTNTTASSFPTPPIEFEVNGEAVRELPIYAVVDQCAREIIFSAYSLSCKAKYLTVFDLST